MALFSKWFQKRKSVKKIVPAEPEIEMEMNTTLQSADRVFDFFREISAIPRASFDEERISNYLVSFARSRNLEVYQDESHNVVIKKPSNIPNCKCPPVIIQGHMDMVYVQAPDCKRSYEDGVGIIEKDGWLCADGTTLGADNGIAVAYELALLDSDNIPHPDLEMIFTVQEEVGMFGAEKIDCSDLRGKYFINLDTEDEGVFFTGCAGAVRSEVQIPIDYKKVKTSHMKKLVIKLEGLAGGHSGMEIHKCRGNAIVLLGRLISEAGTKGVHLQSMECNGKMNAIANNAKAVLYVKDDRIGEVMKSLENSVSDFKHELDGIDDVQLKMKIKKCKKKTVFCYSKKSMKRALAAISLLPNGMLNMSHKSGIVETSANMGILTEVDDKLLICSAIRSSVGTKKKDIARKYKTVAKLCGGYCKLYGDYPQWDYRENSPLRDVAMETYREIFGKEPVTRAVHCGLECGYFDQKLKDADVISFGPDQEDVHTPKERLNIASVERVWKLLQAMLEKLGNGKVPENI